MAKKMTYAQAHAIIMAHLEENGWTVKRFNGDQRHWPMKVPHATSPSGHKRLYFKAQAVYQAHAPNLQFKFARTLTYDTISIKEWAQAIQNQSA